MTMSIEGLPTSETTVIDPLSQLQIDSLQEDKAVVEDVQEVLLEAVQQVSHVNNQSNDDENENHQEHQQDVFQENTEQENIEQENNEQEDPDDSQKPHVLRSDASILAWFAPNSFLTRVAETAKSSVDSMITTLDPGMKEYLFSGGDVSIVVASEKEVKVAPVRDAFIDVFRRATVKGVSVQPLTVAAQPVGPQAALTAAQERISFIRSNFTHDIPQNQVIVSIESFLQEMTPGSWFETALFLLDDPLLSSSSGNQLVLYSQSTPVPLSAINTLMCETPKEYSLKETGFSKTIGEYMANHEENGFKCVSHESWHESLIGVPRRSLLYMTACALASLYREKCHLHNNNRVQTV